MFNEEVLKFKMNAHLTSLEMNKFAAWKAFSFVIVASVLYQILVFFPGLNNSFFIFQILIMLEAGTFLAHFVLLIKNQEKIAFVNLAVGLAFLIPALSPFLLDSDTLHVADWEMWAFLYFAVGYPISYLCLSLFNFLNRKIYYKTWIPIILGIIFIILALANIAYAILYGAYQHYIELSFVPRRTVALIVFNVQFENISLVERLFQFSLLLNTACISNYKFSKNYGVVTRNI